MKTTGKVYGITLALACGLATTLNAQNIYVASGSGTIGEYGSDGSPIDATLITGLTGPAGMAISGNDLFVATYGTGAIGIYNATTGASAGGFSGGTDGLAISGGNLFAVDGSTIGKYTLSGTPVSAPLVTGLNSPYGIAISGTNIYVANFNVDFEPGSIGEYSTSGAPLSPSLISGLTGGPYGVAASGDDLFVGNYNTGTISEYTLGGQLVSASFITGLAEPGYMALYGNDLFVVNDYTGTVGEYDATTGDAINATLITGLANPSGIVVTAPEPSTIALVGLGAAALCLWRRRGLKLHQGDICS